MRPSMPSSDTGWHSRRSQTRRKLAGPDRTSWATIRDLKPTQPRPLGSEQGQLLRQAPSELSEAACHLSGNAPDKPLPIAQLPAWPARNGQSFPDYSRWSSTRLRAIGRFLASNWNALPLVVMLPAQGQPPSVAFFGVFLSRASAFPLSHRLTAVAERFAHRLLKSGSRLPLPTSWRYVSLLRRCPDCWLRVRGGLASLFDSVKSV